MPIKIGKIKAFTLSEMLVVLLITSIVVGLAFSVLQLIQKQMKGLEAHYQKNTEFNSLQQALWVDLNGADRTFLSSDKKTLELNNPVRQLTYQFEENQIIRQLDTFYLGQYSVDFYFKNRIPTANEIDALKIIQKRKITEIPLFVFKTNSATTYMNF